MSPQYHIRINEYLLLLRGVSKSKKTTEGTEKEHRVHREKYIGRNPG